MIASRSANGELRMPLTKPRRQSGFTYIGVLVAIAFMGIGLLAISEVWTTTAERQKITQLDWVGEQYVQAIQSYYYANTGSVHIYPAKLEDLLEDKRHLTIKRHIRTLYVNPFTGNNSWKTLSAAGGGIQGIEYQGLDPDRPVKKQFVFIPVK